MPIPYGWFAPAPTGPTCGDAPSGKTYKEGMDKDAHCWTSCAADCFEDKCNARANALCAAANKENCTPGSGSAACGGCKAGYFTGGGEKCVGKFVVSWEAVFNTVVQATAAKASARSDFDKGLAVRLSKLFGTKSYAKLSKGDKSWSDARKACQQGGMDDLAVITSQAENQKASSASGCDNQCSTWIGLHDTNQEGKWYCSFRLLRRPLPN